MGDSVRSSVIVVTYQNPRYLDLVLAGLQRQVTAADEVIIADDGSDAATAVVVDRWRHHLPLRHVWHDDQGVRKAAIVNAAMAVAGGDLFAFLDGDTIPHCQWLADHLRLYDGASIACGRRVRLQERLSRRLCGGQVSLAQFDSPFTRTMVGGYLRREVRRFPLAIRLPTTLRLLVASKQKGLMGCNFSGPARVFEAVNGYDAAWDGAAHLCEDYDLELRLRTTGVSLRPAVHTAPVFHLFHRERPMTEQAAALRRARAGVDCRYATDGIVEAGQRLLAGTVRLDPG